MTASTANTASSYNWLQGWSPILEATDSAIKLSDLAAPYATACRETLFAWAEAASQVLVDIGVDLTPYKHRLFILPSIRPLAPACTWTGMASVGPGLRPADLQYTGVDANLDAGDLNGSGEAVLDAPSVGLAWVSGSYALSLQVSWHTYRACSYHTPSA